MAKRTIGPFLLEKRLGVGGMGIVYLATHVKSDQKAAVKVLMPGLSADQQLLKRFVREMKILKKLRHTHIVRYYGGGKHKSQHFYAMELMRGGSIEDMLQRKGKLSWEQTIECGMQIAKALEYAHHHGIIHRDLKPANLFLSEKGKLKLGDFGIARDTQATALTAAGKTVGTYAYMAPEQISGKPPISRKTDLYALGCVMFEMLTGQPPFVAETMASMLMQHLQDEPPRVTSLAIDCPIWLDVVVTRLLGKDPEERYYDALAVQVALQEVGQKVADQTSISQQTVAGGATTVLSQKDRPTLDRLLGKKKKRRKKKKQIPFYEQIWFLTSCLVLLAAGITWLMWPMSEEKLFARAEQLMASENSDKTADWRTARKDYLEPLLKRFPDGQYAEPAREYIEQIEMDLIQRRAETAAHRNLKPRSAAERLFIEAYRFETEANDRITALAKYRRMITVLEGNKTERAYVNLARRRITEIQAGIDSNQTLTLINDNLRRAEKYVSKGESLKADTIWDSIVALYSSNKEFEQQVKYARARRDGQEVEPLDLGEQENPKSDGDGPVER